MTQEERDKYIGKEILWYNHWDIKAKIINADDTGFIIQILKTEENDYYQKGDVVHIGANTVMKFI